MYYIAECESGTQQFLPNGHLVRDHVTGTHVGIYQISVHYKKDALSHGWDITTREGNTEYALYLYNNEGTRPWDASKPCWQPKINRLANLENT